MIEFIKETLLLLPFLFATYLALEAIEAHAGGALEKFLSRAHSIGPLAGALAGAVPQCGISAAAASFYAGGVITVGTLIAVFLSTSDELIPVLLSKQIPLQVLVKIVLLKIVAGILAGFFINAVLACARHFRRPVSVHDLCEKSHCGCHKHTGILIPALIHTLEIFIFIVIVSGAVELCLHFCGEDAFSFLCLNRPILGECAAGLLGLIPNCAVSVVGAELYCKGAMSAGAMMASSFTGSGLGLLVLFRTNRSFTENILILISVYVIGVICGGVAGIFL